MKDVDRDNRARIYIYIICNHTQVFNFVNIFLLMSTTKVPFGSVLNLLLYRYDPMKFTQKLPQLLTHWEGETVSKELHRFPQHTARSTRMCVPLLFFVLTIEDNITKYLWVFDSRVQKSHYEFSQLHALPLFIINHIVILLSNRLHLLGCCSTSHS